MTPDERARYYDEQRAKEDTPSPQAMQTMQQQAKEAKDRKATDKAYEDASKRRYAKGGYVRAADGCAQRGKTKGQML